MTSRDIRWHRSALRAHAWASSYYAAIHRGVVRVSREAYVLAGIERVPMKLTSQGVRDLNAKPVNGHRRVVCSHLAGPARVIYRRLVGDYYYEDMLGKYCLKHGEVCG